MEKYEIVGMIDEGAYGIVWKAQNKNSKEIVAIKQFKQGEQDDASMVNIQRQIKMLKLLKSDYVVNMKEAFKKKGKVYIIFQYFPKNLLNLIEKSPRGLPAPLINRLIYLIIRSLSYIHSQNIIHRDIKPENILINQDQDHVKICDFGFARFLPSPTQYDLTEYVATRWYRSPQLLVGQPYSQAADIWALGCMIGELVDGQPMFPGDDEIDQIYLINKALGKLSKKQLYYFDNNPKFVDLLLPEVNVSQPLEMRYLGSIQKNALNFMKACLKMNPLQRITVQEALKHPYLLKFNDQQDSSSDKQIDMLDTIQQMNPQQKLTSKMIDKDKTAVFLTKNNQINHGKLSVDHKAFYQKDAQIKKSMFAKRTSQTNLHINNLSLKADLLPKINKLPKTMSQNKQIKVQASMKISINLGTKHKEKDTDIRLLEQKLRLQPKHNRILPEISIKQSEKSKHSKINASRQKISSTIKVIDANKDFVKGSKVFLAVS